MWDDDDENGIEGTLNIEMENTDYKKAVVFPSQNTYTLDRIQRIKYGKKMIPKINK